jgi:hypothetical protein
MTGTPYTPDSVDTVDSVDAFHTLADAVGADAGRCPTASAALHAWTGHGVDAVGRVGGHCRG